MSDGVQRPGWLALLLAPRPLRWSLVELCRRTTLDGWDELLSAAAAGRGVALLASSDDQWPVAARALAGWAGPLHLALTADGRSARWARLWSADGESSPRPADGADAVGKALAAGEKVLFVIEAGSPPRPTAIPDGVPVLDVAIERPQRGRYRLVIRPSPRRRLRPPRA